MQCQHWTGKLFLRRLKPLLKLSVLKLQDSAERNNPCLFPYIQQQLLLRSLAVLNTDFLIDVLSSHPVNLCPDWIAVEALDTLYYGCEDTSRSEPSEPIQGMSRHQVGIFSVGSQQWKTLVVEASLYHRTHESGTYILCVGFGQKGR